MTAGYDRVFAILPIIEPPEGLYGAILTRIAHMEERKLRRRVLIFIPAACTAFCGTALSSLWAVSALGQSAFFEYVALVFSDTALVLTNWQTFALSLLESVPLLATTVLLASLFTSLGLLRLALPARRGYESAYTSDDYPLIA